MAAKKKAPWRKANPKQRSRRLTPKQRTAAKRSAKRAGRPYPNLVDNMNAARTSSGRKRAAKKKTTKKKTPKKHANKK